MPSKKQNTGPDLQTENGESDASHWEPQFSSRHERICPATSGSTASTESIVWKASTVVYNVQEDVPQCRAFLSFISFAKGFLLV